MKARLRILLTLAYVLVLAGHGLEHRSAGSTPTTQAADKEACDACAFLTYAGHTLGTNARSAVPFDLPAPVFEVPAIVAANLAPVLPFSGPLGARAPPVQG